MKLTAVMLKEPVPVAGLGSTRHVTADKVAELAFEAGLVSIVDKAGGRLLVPAHNAVSMVPADAPPKEAKKP